MAGKSGLTSEHVLIKKGDLAPRAIRQFYPELVDGSVAADDIPVEVFYWDGKFVGFSTGYKWMSVETAPPPAPAPAPAQVIPFVQRVEVRPRSFVAGTYAEYLATPEFRKIAARARKEWGYRCLLNANHPGPVEMHHRSYADVPFREDWRTLIPLCEECHERYHGKLPKPPRGLFDEPEELKRAA